MVSAPGSAGSPVTEINRTAEFVPVNDTLERFGRASSWIFVAVLILSGATYIFAGLSNEHTLPRGGASRLSKTTHRPTPQLPAQQLQNSMLSKVALLALRCCIYCMCTPLLLFSGPLRRRPDRPLSAQMPYRVAISSLQ